MCLLNLMSKRESDEGRDRDYSRMREDHATNQQASKQNGDTGAGKLNRLFIKEGRSWCLSSEKRGPRQVLKVLGIPRRGLNSETRECVLWLLPALLYFLVLLPS